MVKLLFSSFLALFFMSGQAQFSMHFGATGGSAIGLRAKPYNNPFVDLELLGGGEVGYRLTERLEVRAFGYFGASSKDDLSEDTPSKSRLTQLGLKPQFTLISSSNHRYNFDIGLPISFLRQEVNWKGYVDWSTTSGLAEGIDKARFVQIGIMPAYRFYSEEKGLTWTLGIVANHSTLLDAHRKVYTPEQAPDSFESSEVWHPNWSVGVIFTLGYVF